jgi:hypothetical protein
MADSGRWERFVFRPDDIVISTPSKCGTTWMQTIVGMLVLGRVRFGAPISTISPWLDMLVRTEGEVFELLEGQSHRRFIKTHTPLDGLPLHEDVTYIAVVRHPLDVALSDRDHAANMDTERAIGLRLAASGEPEDLAPRTERPDEVAAYLRWFIDNDEAPTGSGPNGLEDYCQQIRTYWDARHELNVHLFHYADLWADRDTEMRRVAEALGVPIEEETWPAYVAAASLESMRERASDTAPEAHLSLWQSDRDFFRSGGPRAWAQLLSPEDVAHFQRRMQGLAGDAAAWALQGRPS